MKVKDLFKLSEEHSYYSSLSNYYSNEAGERYESMEDFLSEWKDADIDYNLCFRWDVKKRTSSDEEIKQYGKYWAEVFFIQQRKGIYYPITIESIRDEDVEAFLDFLKPHKEYISKLWNI